MLKQKRIQAPDLPFWRVSRQQVQIDASVRKVDFASTDRAKDTWLCIVKLLVSRKRTKRLYMTRFESTLHIIVLIVESHPFYPRCFDILSLITRSTWRLSIIKLEPTFSRSFLCSLLLTLTLLIQFNSISLKNLN